MGALFFCIFLFIKIEMLLDMSLCGINPSNLSETTLDNIHPNEAGTRLIVDYLSSELKKIYAN